jgi:VanZ family protein
MFFRYNLFAILWVLLILLLGLSPGDAMPNTDVWDFLSFDKVAHFFVFSVLCLLLIIGFTKQYSFKFIKYNSQKIAVSFSVLYGLLIELGQSLVPGRGLEYADLLANTIGAITGWLIFYLIYKV